MPGQRPAFPTAFSTYVSLRILGEGGAGYVHEVQDNTGQRFALKVLKPQAVTDDRRKRFKNEIAFCQRTSHPNVVKVLDHGLVTDEDPPLPFYVMPIYEFSLRALMANPLPEGSHLRFYFQILDGTEAAHIQGVAHRDLKPENLLYDKANDRLVVADFGIARFQEDELYTAVETKASDRLANFQYAAPEQRLRGAEVDSRADIYSLGLILNELFTGQIPLGSGYRKVQADFPEYGYLDDTVESMIRQDPANRPQSIDLVRKDLVARAALHASEERLRELKATVTPKDDIADPLIANPVRLVDFDWDKGELTLILSQPVNEKWIWALRNMGNYSSVHGMGPEVFSIRGDRALIQAREVDVPAVISYFKGWLPRVAQVYEQALKDDRRRRDEQQARELQAEIQAEEARARLRKAIKI